MRLCFGSGTPYRLNIISFYSTANVPSLNSQHLSIVPYQFLCPNFLLPVSRPLRVARPKLPERQRSRAIWEQTHHSRRPKLAILFGAGEGGFVECGCGGSLTTESSIKIPRLCHIINEDELRVQSNGKYLSLQVIFLLVGRLPRFLSLMVLNGIINVT